LAVRLYVKQPYEEYESFKDQDKYQITRKIQGCFSKRGNNIQIIPVLMVTNFSNDRLFCRLNSINSELSVPRTAIYCSTSIRCIAEDKQFLDFNRNIDQFAIMGTWKPGRRKDFFQGMALVKFSRSSQNIFPGKGQMW